MSRIGGKATYMCVVLYQLVMMPIRMAWQSKGLIELEIMPCRLKRIENKMLKVCKFEKRISNRGRASPAFLLERIRNDESSI